MDRLADGTGGLMARGVPFGGADGEWNGAPEAAWSAPALSGDPDWEGRAVAPAHRGTSDEGSWPGDHALL